MRPLHLDTDGPGDDFTAAAAAAGIHGGGAPAAPASAPAAAASGTKAALVRASSRMPASPAPAPDPAFPTSWQDSNEPGQCELTLFALLWLQTVALQSPAVLEVARSKRRNKQTLRLDDIRQMDINLQMLVTFKKARGAHEKHANERLGPVVAVLLCWDKLLAGTGIDPSAWVGVNFTAPQLLTRLIRVSEGRKGREAKNMLWNSVQPRWVAFRDAWWALLSDNLQLLYNMFDLLLRPPSAMQAATAVAQLRTRHAPRPAAPMAPSTGAALVQQTLQQEGERAAQDTILELKRENVRLERDNAALEGQVQAGQLRELELLEQLQSQAEEMANCAVGIDICCMERRGTRPASDVRFRPIWRGRKRGQSPAPAPPYTVKSSPLTSVTTTFDRSMPILPDSGHTAMPWCPPEQHARPA